MSHQLRFRTLRVVAILLASWLLFSADVNAVVIDVGDGSGNTTAPDDDPGFANAGLRGVGTAIYLGNRWVLTANHVGAGPVTFGDEVFTHIPDEVHRLKNPNSSQTDMLLMRLEEEPDLPSLRLGCKNLSLFTEVVLVGAGRDRNEELSFWSVDENPGNSDDVWTAVATAEDADVLGFRTESSRTIRWGTAIVTNSNIDVKSANDGNVLSFQTTFDTFDETSLQESLNVENLGQAVTGDSGGPVFLKNGDFWELAGMIHGVTPPRENQPGGSGTVLFGNSTFAANIIKYRDEILAIADLGIPTGDFDGNGAIDAGDIDQLHAAVDNSDNNCHYDLSGNGVVTAFDVSALLAEAGTLAGDVDLDGKVAFADFLILARAFGDSGLGWAGGDFDGDGSTNFGDFIALSNAFGDEASVSTATVSSVPEPSTALFALIGALVFVLRSRR